MLQRQGRLTYQTLQLQFHLDDAHLEVLKNQLLYAHSPMVSDDGRGLIWAGDSPEPAQIAHPVTDEETRFHALIPAAKGWLQRERRVTYHTLKYVFGIDDILLGKIQEELTFQRLAVDENGKGLVWTGEVQTPVSPVWSDQNQPALTETTEPPLISTSDTQSNGSTASTVLLDESISSPESIRSTPDAERRQLTVMFCDLVAI